MLAVVAVELRRPIKWNMGLAHRGKQVLVNPNAKWKTSICMTHRLKRKRSDRAHFAIKGNMCGFPVHVESFVTCTKGHLSVNFKIVSIFMVII